MTPQIIEKLNAEIKVGIKKESQVVYLLAGIRKIIEQENISPKDYFYLKFHCDWALHSKLDRKSAQDVLGHFNTAYLQLVSGDKLTSISETDKISKMDQFQEELSAFLKAHSITDFSESPDQWPKFLYLYARVIEDVPLVIRDGSSADIREVIVSVELAKELVADHQFFKVSWRLIAKDGKAGIFYVIHSFPAKE